MQDSTQPAPFRRAVMHAVQAAFIGSLLLSLLCALRASAAEPPPDPLVELLGQVDDAAVQLDVLHGMQRALAGRRGVPMPPNWASTAAKLAKSPNAEVRSTAQALSVIYGDRQALEAVRTMVANAKAPLEERRSSLGLLVDQRDAQLGPLLLKLLDDASLRSEAIKAMAAYDEGAADALLKRYAKWPEADRQNALATLVSRPKFALALLDAMEHGQVARTDVNTFQVRQMLSMNDAHVKERVNQVWGTVRPAGADKTVQMQRYKQVLTPAYLAKADLSRGRLTFARTCAGCHKLFDDGHKVGPELTGAQRTNLDYVLENLLDPSAIVGRDYQMTVLATTDGRVLNGIIMAENDKVLTLQTQNDRIVVDKSEIEARERSPLSLMPEGQLTRLTDEQVRDLVAYLGAPGQVPLPRGEAPAGN